MKHYFILVSLTICVSFYANEYSFAEDDVNPTWLNSSNITGENNIRKIEPNTLDETVFITSGGTISQWGIHNETLIREIYPDSLGGLRDMEWNDDYQLMAWVHDGSMSENPSMWWSQLVIYNLETTPVNAFKPYGGLPSYQSTVIDVAWRPGTVQIGVAFSDGTFRLYDIINNTVVVDQQFEFDIKQFSWNPFGSLVSLVLEDEHNSTSHLHFIDISQNTTWYSGTLMNINDIDWSFDGHFFFMSTSQGIRKKDVSTWESTIIYDHGNVFLSSCPVAPILAIHGEYGINFFNYSNNSSQFHSISAKYQPDSSWSADGTFLISVTNNDIVRIWVKASLDKMPTVRIRTPSIGSQVSGTINISGWASSVSPESLIIHLQVGNNDWILLNGTSQWEYQYDTRKINDGLLKIKARAHDSNGYSDISIIYLFVSNEEPVVDEPPSVFIEYPANGTEIRGVITVNGRAIDDIGVVSVQVRLENGRWISLPSGTPLKEFNWSFLSDISSILPGPLTISVRSFDGIHFSKINQRNVNIGFSNLNNSNLRIKIIYPKRGDVVGTDINVIGIVENGIAESVFVKLDNAEIFRTNGTGRWNIIFSDIGTGPHTISAIAINLTEVSQWYSTSFYVDEDTVAFNYPPLVGIIEPIQGQLIKEPIIIKGWSYDDDNVNKVEIKMNNDPWQLVNGTTLWNYFFDSNNVSDGAVNISVRAFDGTNHSEITTIFIYNENPDQQPNGNGQSPTDSSILSILSIIIIILIILVAYLLKINRTKDSI
jgi:hypothetical protein